MKARIPDATVERLPRYLRCLADLGSETSTCSSDDLATIAGVSAAQVRKDLSYLGSHGTRGVGYDPKSLMVQIRMALGMTSTHPVAVVGAGNMGTALANYRGFANWGFEIVAILDVSPEKVGTTIDGLRVKHLNQLEQIVADQGIRIGIIATPPSAAQTAADRLTASGIKSILNLAPTVLKTAEDVSVRRVDLSTELGILAFHMKA